MIGTAECIYETPCGWCSKWDKKCDKKAHGITLGKPMEILPGDAGCAHTWRMHHYTPFEIVYECDRCGAARAEPRGTRTC